MQGDPSAREPDRDDRYRSTRVERVAAITVAVLLGMAAIFTAVVVGRMFGAGAAVLSVLAFVIVLVVVGFDWVG